jgi:hypothetical protein
MAKSVSDLLKTSVKKISSFVLFICFPVSLSSDCGKSLSKNLSVNRKRIETRLYAGVPGDILLKLCCASADISNKLNFRGRFFLKLENITT